MGIGPQRLGSSDIKSEGYTPCGAPLKQNANFAPYGVQEENVVVNPPSAKDQMKWRRHTASMLNAKNPEDIIPLDTPLDPNAEEVAVVKTKEEEVEEGDS